MYAHQLMPRDGLTWIASNARVLEIWLALLEEDAVSAEALGAILDRADSIAIQQQLHNLALQTSIIPRERRGHLSTFVDQIPESSMHREHALGLEFMDWLHERLEQGQYQMNDKPLFLVDGGVLIDDDAFKQFVQDHEVYKNWHAVQQAVLSLQLHRTHQLDAVAQHEHGHGIVIKNSIILPESFILNTPTGRNQINTTALALNEYRKRLSIHGTWDKAATTATHLNQPHHRPPYG